MTAYLQASYDFGKADFVRLYDDVPYWSFRFGDLFFQHLDLKPNLQVLDLACGTGFPLFQLAQMHGQTGQFIGLDVWTEALNRAQAKKDYFQVPQVSLVHADGAYLPFLNGSFDLIVSNLGINNFDNAPDVYLDCARILKTGGRIAISSNFMGHMAEFYQIYRAVLVDFGNAEYLTRLEQHIAHRGTVASHQALMEQAGFTLTKTVETQFQMRFLNGTALLHYPLIQFGFLPAWRSIVNTADESTIFNQLEHALNASGELSLTIPMLYLEGRKKE